MSPENLLYFLGAFVGTLVLLRVSLYFFPHTDVFIAGYNVHHLYTGAFILVLLTPLLLVGVFPKILAALSGVAAALIIDHLVCLTVGTCGEKTYTSKQSFWGMMIFASIVVGITVALYVLI